MLATSIYSLVLVQVHHLKGFKTFKMLQVLRTQLVLFGWEKLIIKNAKSPQHQYVLCRLVAQQNIEQLKRIMGVGKHNKRTIKMNDILYIATNIFWLKTLESIITNGSTVTNAQEKCIPRKHMHGIWISLVDSSNDVELAFLCEVCQGSKPN